MIYTFCQMSLIKKIKFCIVDLPFFFVNYTIHYKIFGIYITLPTI